MIDEQIESMELQKQYELLKQEYKEICTALWSELDKSTNFNVQKELLGSVTQTKLKLEVIENYIRSIINLP
jgi:hypothetical protein